MSKVNWSDVEKKLILDLYPNGGVAAVIGFLPRRSPAAIKRQACNLRVSDETSAFSHPNSRNESPVPLPAPHDYSDADRAWQSTRLPVYATGFGAAVIRAEVAL